MPATIVDLDNGLDRLLASSDPNDVRHHMAMMQGVKKLTLPSEMGERFKVMMLTRGTDASLAGEQSRDLRASL